MRIVAKNILIWQIVACVGIVVAAVLVGIYNNYWLICFVGVFGLSSIACTVQLQSNKNNTQCSNKNSIEASSDIAIPCVDIHALGKTNPLTREKNKKQNKSREVEKSDIVQVGSDNTTSNLDSSVAWNESIKKLSKTTIIIAWVSLAIYVLLVLTKFDGYFSDRDSLRAIIKSTGIAGMSIYFALCLLQVVILPIPSVILTIVGANMFGGTVAFVLTTIATIIGSAIGFYMGRLWGKKVIIWSCGEHVYNKYNKLVMKSGKYYLGLMFFLPIFPDDILCMLAGAGKMKWKEFLIICILTRPIMIAFTCYFGTGEIIPFSGWGLLVWAGIFIVFGLLFFIGHKINKKIEA